MNKGTLWFFVSIFGTISGGVLGAFLGVLLLLAAKGTETQIAYPRWGFYIFAMLGAHFAISLTMRKVEPHARPGTKLRVFSFFGMVLPAMILLVCRAVESSAN